MARLDTMYLQPSWGTELVTGVVLLTGPSRTVNRRVPQPHDGIDHIVKSGGRPEGTIP